MLQIVRIRISPFAAFIFWLICSLCAAMVFIAIFMLTEQTPDRTTDISSRVEQVLVQERSPSAEHAPVDSETQSVDSGGVSQEGFEAPAVSIAEFSAALLPYSLIDGALSIVGVRVWAHTAEFFCLGFFVALSVRLWTFERVGGFFRRHPILLSLCISAVCSLFDQTHKLFVPGREFDPRDLLFDAMGYMIAVLLVAMAHRCASALRGARR